MSLVPRNTSNNPNPSTQFPQDLWDHFFSQDQWLQPFRDLPLPFPSSFPFLFPPFSARTVSYSELAVETSGDVTSRLECKETPEAHIIVADLPGIENHEVEVAAEDGGFVKIRGQDGRFSCRLRLPEDAKVHLMSWSMENGVLTVVVPKLAVESDWERENRTRNVRVVEISGSD